MNRALKIIFMALLVPLFVGMAVAVAAGLLWLGVWITGDKDTGIIVSGLLALSLVGALIGWASS